MKARYNNQKVYPKKVLLGKETKLIAKNFNKFFREIGPKLASQIEKPAENSEVYFKKVDMLQREFFSLFQFFSLQAKKVRVMMKSVLILLRVNLDL